MGSQDAGKPLPKFGEWDVNNPASAEGFTVIFSKARDQKMNNEAGNSTMPTHNKPHQNYNNDAPKALFLILLMMTPYLLLGVAAHGEGLHKHKKPVKPYKPFAKPKPRVNSS